MLNKLLLPNRRIYTHTHTHTYMFAKIQKRGKMYGRKDVCVCGNKIKISPLISVIIMCERILIMKQANGRKLGQ